MRQKKGSVLLITLFTIGIFSALVVGMLWVSTEEIQLMKNELFAAQALCIAHAGLNDALAQLRTDADWDDGFTNKSFAEGQYNVTVSDNTIESIATSQHGYIARVQADVTISDTSPYVIRIDNLRIN